MRHALDMGYKFGFTGGTDNHHAEPGNPDLGGITGIYAFIPGDTDDAVLEWEDPQPVAQRVQPRKLSNAPFAYYYLRVTTVNGDIGWSSPIWVSVAGREES